MKISKVKLEAKGVKGLTVGYMVTEKKGDYEYQNEHVSKFKMPVDAVYRAKMDELVSHLDSILCIQDGDTEVLGITGKDEGFLLTGWINTGIANKGAAINTPYIAEGDGYEGYDDVMAVIEEVFALTVAYIEKGTQVQSKQFVLDLFDAGQAKGVEKDQLEAMSDAEATEYMTKWLEKKGAIVMAPEDMGEKEESAEPGFDAEEEAVKETPVVQMGEGKKKKAV